MTKVPGVVLAVAGGLAILMGLLWMGQGLNLIPGSFMTGDPTWFVIGAVLVLAGVLLLITARKRLRTVPRRR